MKLQCIIIKVVNVQDTVKTLEQIGLEFTQFETDSSSYACELGDIIFQVMSDDNSGGNLILCFENDNNELIVIESNKFSN